MELADMTNTSLMEALQQGKSAEFEALLEKSPHLDLNIPHFGLNGRTLLHEAVAENQLDIVKVLLAKGAEAYQVIAASGQSTLHVAAEKANPDVMKILLDKMSDKSKINSQDTSKQATPLHILVDGYVSNQASDNFLQCINLLLELKSGPDVNISDSGSQTVLMKAAKHTIEWLVRALIKAGANLELAVPQDTRTLRELLQATMPQCPLPAPMAHIPDIDLWGVIRNGDEDLFHRLVSGGKWPEGAWDASNGSHTFLQLACLKQKENIVQDLLDLGADPSFVANPGEDLPPAFIAAKEKNPAILEKLKAQSRTNFQGRIQHQSAADFNILHMLLSPDHNSWNVKGKINWKLLEKVLKCLRILLGDDCCFQDSFCEIVNASDSPGKNTPLHYATHLPCQVFTSYLLEKGAGQSLFAKNVHGWEPITRIHVDTLRTYLDSCIKFGNSPMDKSFKVVFPQEMFLPIRSYDEARQGDDVAAENNNAMEANLLEEKRPFCYNDVGGKNVPELEHILKLKDQHHDLFDHPIIASMINKKWNHFKGANWLISVVIMLKLMFHGVSIAFVMATFGGKSLGLANQECVKFNLTNDDRFISANCYPVQISETLRWILLGFWVFFLTRLLVRVALQIKCTCSGTMAYLGLLWSPIDFKVHVVSMVIVPFLTVVSPITTGDYGRSRDLAGLFILLCFCELCFIIRDHLGNRKLASMINWTQTVSSSMISFFKVHTLLFFGFILGFYIQLHQDVTTSAKGEDTNTFSRLIQMPIKIMAMFIGELEYGDHPFVQKYPFNYIVLVLFVFLVVIVMMNLLTGVALMDVQEITNASSDDTWYALAVKMSLWEDGFIKLAPLGRLFRIMKRKLYVFKPGQQLVCYPNAPRATPRVGELAVREKAIFDVAKQICIDRLVEAEKTMLKNLEADKDAPNSIPECKLVRMSHVGRNANSLVVQTNL